VLAFFLRPENASIWAEVQAVAQKGDEATLHAYVAEAQRLTSSQRNVRVAKTPGEVDGQSIAPGTAVVLMLVSHTASHSLSTRCLTVLQGEAGRNPKEIQDADKFNAQRKVQDVSAFSYGQHECIAKDVALAFVTGLIKLVADLKELRPAPGQMGLVKTIRVGTEKAYLNDSWSYLGFDASSKFLDPMR
jgi:cytochrome P450